MEDQVEIRAAKVEDFQELVEISKGIYFNTDYLALVYHHWLELERLDQLTNARLINLGKFGKPTRLLALDSTNLGLVQALLTWPNL